MAISQRVSTVKSAPRSNRPSATAPLAPLAPLDPVALRRDFPIFERDFDGRTLAYLDSAATTLKPQAVIDAVSGYYSRYTANVHRGIYRTAEEATAAYEGAREKTARFIGAPSAREIVFVRNATEAINLVASTWGRRSIGRGRHDRPDRDGAPFEPRSLAVPRARQGRRPRVRLDRRRGPPGPGELRRPPPNAPETRRVHPRLEHARDDQPGALHGGSRARGRGARPHRRRAGRAPPAGGRRRAGRRLLRVQRPQDARPHRLRRSLGAPRAPRGDAAVHGRRRDDPRGPPAVHGVQRRPLEVRGGHPGHRRGHRPGRGRRLPCGSRHGASSRARACAHGVRAGGAPPGRAGDHALRPARPR